MAKLVAPDIQIHHKFRSILPEFMNCTKTVFGKGWQVHHIIDFLKKFELFLRHLDKSLCKLFSDVFGDLFTTKTEVVSLA